jgi:putative ABC transport system ATP-binding protein
VKTGRQPAAPFANSQPGSGSGIAARLVDASRYYEVGGQPAVALDRVTVEFASDRFTTVTGPSGSGKSTLLHCLAGLEQLSSGSVFLGDVELGALRPSKLRVLRRERVGVIFQGFNLYPGLDVADNLALPSVIMGRKPDPDWFEHVVGQLGLGDRLRRRPYELSGGEQQRVAAARALIGRPALIVADEPTGNLDQRNGHQLLEALRLAVDELAQTVVMASHDPAAAAVGDTVVKLLDGQLVGTVDTVDRSTSARSSRR